MLVIVQHKVKNPTRFFDAADAAAAENAYFKISRELAGGLSETAARPS